MKRQPSTWLAYAIFLLTTVMLTTAPLAADCSHPCATSTLRPGALSARLPVGDLFPGSAALGHEVITEPRFGTLAGYKYSPGPDFWLAGADRVRIRDLATGVVGTIVVRAAEMYGVSIIQEDFEVHPVDDLQLPWIDVHLLGSATLSPIALSGQKSLAISLVSAVPEVPTEGTSTGQGHMGVDYVINNEAPDDPWNQTAFEVVLVNMESYAGVNLRRENELSEVRAWADCGGSSCETPWQPLVNGETYHLTLSVGRQDVEDSNGEWGLTLLTSAVDGSWSAADQLLGLSAPGNTLPRPNGLVSGTPSGKLFIDDVTSWTATLEPLPGLRFEDFEGSESSTWSTEGAVSVVDTGTDLGNSGACSFWRSSTAPSSGWIDSRPSFSKKVTAQAQIDLRQLTLPPGSFFQLFTGSDAAAVPVFSITVKIDDGGSAKARARLRRSDGSSVTSAWAPLEGEIHDIEVAWSADDDESATLRLWVGEHFREIDLPGAGLGVTIDELTVGAKQLVPGQGTYRGGTLLVDNVLFTY